MTEISAEGFINLAHSCSPPELAGPNGQCSTSEYLGGVLKPFEMAAKVELGAAPSTVPQNG